MINVIGLGYIGLPTSLIMASSGLEVVGTDINEENIKKLTNRKITFKEKGLQDLLDSAVRNGIKFTTEYQVCDCYIIAVPTPYNSDDKKIDATYVKSAMESVLKVCPNDATIIIESTISPGTVDSVIRPIVKKYGKSVNLVHAPERILPGNMLNELRNNSRTIGADNAEIAEKVKKIYSSFCNGEIVLTDIRTAEMSKVVENTYRDINIAFANELAKICRKDGMDVYEIIKIANRHPRVNILNPGPGVGGHCISVDPWFLVGDYPELSKLIKTARDINDSMPEFVINRIKEIAVNNDISMDRVGLYGVTYKADVDDTRESPTLQLIDKLSDEERKQVKLYDPMVNGNFGVRSYTNIKDFLKDIDMMVIMVDHRNISEDESIFRGKVILDTKNIIKSLPTYKL